jgi:hypothetical protein
MKLPFLMFLLGAFVGGFPGAILAFQVVAGSTVRGTAGEAI